jgi:ribosomal protein L15
VAESAVYQTPLEQLPQEESAGFFENLDQYTKDEEKTEETTEEIIEEKPEEVIATAQEEPEEVTEEIIEEEPEQESEQLTEELMETQEELPTEEVEEGDELNDVEYLKPAEEENIGEPSCEDQEIAHERMEANEAMNDDQLSIVNEDGDVTELVESVDYESRMAVVIRYKKSFTAKLIQSKDETKAWYTALKNGFLSYNKVRSRLSWNYDSINSARNQLAKFVVRGKTLCVYFALDPEDYIGTKYKVEADDRKKYEDVPCLYRIKNPRRVKYAMELFAVLAEKYGLEREEEQYEDYYMPYESTSSLLQRGLIKEVYVRESFDDFLRKRDNALKAAGARDDQAETAESEQDDEFERPKDCVEEVRSINPFTGIAFVNRYNQSFMAQVQNAPERTRDYYNDLKNEILSYQWSKGEEIAQNNLIDEDRFVVAKLKMQNGNLNLYLALDPKEYKDYQGISEAKEQETTRCMYQVRNDEEEAVAKSLIAALAEKFARVRSERSKTDNYIPDKAADVRNVAKDNYEEFAILRYLDEVKKMHRKSVSAVAADEMLDDDIAVTLVEDERTDVNVGDRIYSGKKGIVNIDSISRHFNKDEVVTLDGMKARGIVSPKIGYVKVLARGTLNKSLTIEAQDFSAAAVKMVILTGGTARKV